MSAQALTNLGTLDVQGNLSSDDRYVGSTFELQLEGAADRPRRTHQLTADLGDLGLDSLALIELTVDLDATSLTLPVVGGAAAFANAIQQRSGKSEAAE